MDKINTSKKLFKIFFPVLFYGVLVLFIYIYAKNLDYEVIKSAEYNWWYVVFASFFGLFARYWQIFIWYTLLSRLGASNLKDKIPDLIYVYAKSWLGRYIPGTAPWILGKIYFASKLGVSKNKLAISSLLEAGLQVASVTFISLFLFSVDNRLNTIPTELKYISFAILIAICVSLTPKVFNKVISILFSIMKKKSLGVEHQIGGGTILRGFLFYSIGTLSASFAFFLLTKSVYPELGYENLLFTMAAGSLAAVASMVAVFAPGGIGVREGVQLGLLRLIMPEELALLVTVLTRLWSTVMDLLFFVFSKLISIYAKR